MSREIHIVESQGMPEGWEPPTASLGQPPECVCGRKFEAEGALMYRLYKTEENYNEAVKLWDRAQDRLDAVAKLLDGDVKIRVMGIPVVTVEEVRAAIAGGMHADPARTPSPNTASQPSQGVTE